MKRLAPFIIGIVSAVLCFNVIQAQAIQSSPQVRRKAFEVVWKTVNEKYFDPTFGGLDWQQVHERYAPQVALVKSDAELFSLLQDMVDELKVSHLEIVSPSVLERVKQKPTLVGMRLKDAEGQVVIWRIWPNSSASESPLKTGFIIKQIDDIAIENLGDALHKLSGPANVKLKVAYLNERDELKETLVERRLMPLDDLVKEKEDHGFTQYSLFETQRLADGIGYISFSSFITALEERLTKAIASMHDAPGLIIDLRGNGGGDDSVGLAMANMLFDKRTQLMITRTRKGDDLYYRAKPKKDAFLGPLVILLDYESGSASEQFAAGLQEVGRATVIGATTVGEDMDADGVELPTGGFFIYPYGLPRTPKGIVIEGRGVVPDIAVPLKRADLLAGKDSQLEAAIDHLRKQKR